MGFHVVAYIDSGLTSGSPTKDGRFSSLSQYQRIWEEAIDEGMKGVGAQVGDPGALVKGNQPLQAKN